MKILHIADLHYSIIQDKLEEVQRCAGHVLIVAKEEKPDVILVTGDTVDELDGRIRVDSETARAATGFIQGLANIAPVVIIEGTSSHDRKTPWLFSQLRAKYPIYVSDRIEQIGLVRTYDNDLVFMPLETALDYTASAQNSNNLVAAFSLIPSVNKSYLMGQLKASIGEANLQARELMRDVFAGLGLVNQAITSAPRIGVIHGTCTGAVFSNGQVTVGEELEFSLNDLAQMDCDYIGMGHIHKMQIFRLPSGGIAAYSGSIGRLNYGEIEEKGFLMPEFEGQKVKEVKFHKTPARKFALHSVDWDEGGIETIMAEVEKCLADCKGADVRFRYTIPEEEKHSIRKEELEKKILEAGARRVKIEPSIIPKNRTRAAGISKLNTLPEKLKMWGKSVGEQIPQDVLEIASTIEGKDVEELIREVLARINGVVVDTADVEEQTDEPLAKTYGYENQLSIF